MKRFFKHQYTIKRTKKHCNYLKTLIFPSSLESASLARLYGYDEWLGSPNVKYFLEAMNRHPQQYIRTNTLKIDSKELRRSLYQRDLNLKTLFYMMFLPLKMHHFQRVQPQNIY